jgi:hypothetical protein
MGELLTVLFIGTVFFVSGLKLIFTGDDRGRKYGMWMAAIGLVVYLACWLFTPRNDNYRLWNDNTYQL